MRFALTSFMLIGLSLALYSVTGAGPTETTIQKGHKDIQLGNFSISLAVKDIHQSKEFYEKLGFKQTSGDIKLKYVIMQNETSTIGLFQGIIEKNTLTYNPGWDRDCKTLSSFHDIRAIQNTLKERGLTPVVAADEKSSGPAYLTLLDPDGNPILIDQHVSKPREEK